MLAVIAHRPNNRVIDLARERIAMSVSELTDPKRLSLTLDPGLVLERLILQRLSGLKRKRGQDWLRSLLVQGFLAEGRWIRSDVHGTMTKTRVPRETTVPATPFASWLGQAQTRQSARCRAGERGRDGRSRYAETAGTDIETLRPSPQGDRLSPMTLTTGGDRDR